MKIKYLHFFLLLFFLQKVSYSQQYNFSQFYNTPLLVNPAFTGNFAQDVRLGLIYRNQWRNIVGDPYQTASLGADINFPTNFLKADAIGLGLVLLNDRSPDGVFQSNVAMLSFAAHQYLDDENRHKISGGLQAGVGVNSANLSNAIFANQIDTRTNQFSSDISSGEDLSALNKTFVNANIGGAYQFIASKKTTLNLSAALFNLTRYKEGNIGNAVPLRYNFSIGVTQSLTEKLNLVPTVFVTSQSNIFDALAGLNANYSFLPKKSAFALVGTAGVWYRVMDAAIVYGGLQLNNIKLGMSYDFTASSLNTTASSFGNRNAIGSWEISLGYVGFLNRGIPSNVSVPCKIF